jgi:ADP-ribose pyrophosphatase YjhB (NUDIX family)
VSFSNSIKRKVQVVLLWISSNGEKSLLLLRTNQERGGFWQNVTGGVESGESTVRAAKRELFEETGIEDINLIDLQQTHHFTDQYGKTCIESIFLATAQCSFAPELTLSPEHSEYDFRAIEGVMQADFGYNSNYEAFVQAVSHISCPNE